MAKKLTKRKAFSFLRSYFDVLNEIPEDKDKLDFLLSIINKQFLDENPKDLSFIVNLSYESQRHSIEQSVKGYKTKTKTDLLGNPLKDPKQDPCQGGKQDPSQQEKEKEKEQVKEKEKVKEEFNIDLIVDIELLKKHYLKSEKIINAVIKNKENNLINEKDLKDKLDLFHNQLIEKGRLSDKFTEYAAYFRNWCKTKQFQSKDDFTKEEIKAEFKKQQNYRPIL